MHGTAGATSQMIELKYNDRVPPKPTKDMDPISDGHLYLETSSLEKYVGETLHLESLAAKERRKSAEERASAVARKWHRP